MRRAQAALEYLVTYGWAFLAILVVFGALAYFGFVSPDRYLPAKCGFGFQLQCVDYQLEDDTTDVVNGWARLMFQNNFGDSINITDVWISSSTAGNLAVESGGSYVDINDPPFSGNLRVAKGNVSSILQVEYPSGVETNLIEGERQTVYLTVTFRRDKAGSPPHNISGEIFATVQ